MAILPTESTELDFQSALPLDACTFPEQVTTLCWAGYAGPTSLSYRVSAHHRHGIPQRSRAMLLSLTHQLGLTFCSTQEICRICKIAPYCSAPLPVTYSCMLKMANCYTGREYIQARNSGMGEACCKAYQQACTCQKPLGMPHYSSCLSCA